MQEQNGEIYPGARVELVLRIPGFARNVLIVGCGNGGLAMLLRKRKTSAIYGIEWEGPDRIVAREFFDAIVESRPPFSSLPFGRGFFDAIVLSEAVDYLDCLGESVRNLAPFLSPNGHLMFVTPNSVFRGEHRAGLEPASIGGIVGGAGLVPYAHWARVDPALSMIRPDASGSVSIGDRVFDVSNAETKEALTATDYVFFAVWPSYNPILHARELLESGHPDWAYDVLSMIPALYLEDCGVATTVAADMMACLVGMDNAERERGRNLLNRFVLSQHYFYQVVARDPLMHFAYQCQAEFWSRIGNDNMAVRLLDCVNSVEQDSVSLLQRGRYDPVRRSPVVDVVAPEWAPSEGRPRILYITHPRPHYGLDVLYDGLCEVLGEASVVDFPYKPYLHGVIPDELANYPCTFSRVGDSLALEAVLGHLERREFDVVLYGDLDRDMERQTARRIVEAAGDTPIFLVDALDQCMNLRDTALEYLGLESVAGYFKREMLGGVDYGPNTFPLPFAYPDNRVPERITEERPHDFFWAGHRSFGLRRLYLERLEQRFGLKLDASYGQEEYARRLDLSRIGLNIFGFGFDTVRYWEVPAHGCMLLSERLPICIPNNFVGGKSAVFFDTLAELEEKAEYYLNRRDESLAIARAGYQHLKQHHTGSARARQALGWIRSVLNSR